MFRYFRVFMVIFSFYRKLTVQKLLPYPWGGDPARSKHGFHHGGAFSALKSPPLGHEGLGNNFHIYKELILPNLPLPGSCDFTSVHGAAWGILDFDWDGGCRVLPYEVGTRVSRGWTDVGVFRVAPVCGNKGPCRCRGYGTFYRSGWRRGWWTSRQQAHESSPLSAILPVHSFELPPLQPPGSPAPLPYPTLIPRLVCLDIPSIALP